MLIKKIDWNDELQDYFNQETFKQQWKSEVLDIAPNAQPIWIMGANFFCDVESSLLFVSPYDWNPIPCCYTWILIYKNQMVIFGSMTMDSYDLELRVKYLPELLKNEKSIIHNYIKEFINSYASQYYPKFKFEAYSL